MAQKGQHTTSKFLAPDAVVSKIKHDKDDDENQNSAQTPEETAQSVIYFSSSLVSSSLHHHREISNDKQGEKENKSASASKSLQRKRIQREYAETHRRAEQAAREGSTSVHSYAAKAKERARRVYSYAKTHWKGLVLVLALGSVIFALISGVSSCVLMGTSGISRILSSSYLAEDTDIYLAEEMYCAMEEELKNYLDSYENNHSYDEYSYDLDDIEHDPYVLISILSAMNSGQFDSTEIGDELGMLFERQYILTETIEHETRYRTETEVIKRPKRDSISGEFVLDEDGRQIMEDYEREVQIPYTCSICSVKLENFNLSHVPVHIMGENMLSMYAMYMSALGNRPDLFPSSSYVARYTTPPSVYNIPPSAMLDETFAALITEAEKYIGYPYIWGGSKPSTSFDCSGFVSWVLTNSGVCETGRLGAQGLYYMSTPISPENARPGDLVFFVGTYDTDGITHVGIYAGEGMMLHCGDPIQYTDLNSSYWQTHFFAFARPPYND